MGAGPDDAQGFNYHGEVHRKFLETKNTVKIVLCFRESIQSAQCYGNWRVRRKGIVQIRKSH
jgi:hypothetical protein